MEGTKNWWRTLALTGALALVVPAAAVAQSPEPAPPAASARDAESGGVVAPDLALAAQTATVSLGSTEGFGAASPGQLGGWGSGALDPNSPDWYAGTPGATGMWEIEGQVGTTFTIDSCGSSFPAQLAVYYRQVRRDFLTAQAAYSPDGCADPITLPYGKLAGPDGLVRIDDATGAGGPYQVNYTRTPAETTPPRVRVFNPVVEEIRPAKRGSLARVRIEYKVVDDDGSYPLRARCTVEDLGLMPYCNVRTPRVVLRHVPSGRHTFEITASDAVGNEASFTRKFRVPRVAHKR